MNESPRANALFSSISLLVATAAASILTGCAGRTSAASPAASLPQIRGQVHGGQQPITGGTIQLYAVNAAATAGASSPLIAPTVTTSDGTGVGGNAGNSFNSLPAGSFTITGMFSCPIPTSTPVYLVATQGNPGLSAGTNNAAIAMIAALGPCSGLSNSQFINIDEVTTVAAASAFGTLMTDYAHVGSASTATISAAFNLAAELANTSTGLAPGTTVPANSYVPVEKLYSFANTLASCVNTNGSGATGNSTPCGLLFTGSTFSGTMPADTVSAAINIVANPTTNVGPLYGLAAPSPPFQTALALAPSDWMLPIASVAWPAPATVDYGTALSATQLDATATVPGSFAYSPSAGTVLNNVGSTSLSVTFTPTDSADYASTIPASTTVTVNNTPLITWSAPAGMTAGVPLGANQLTAAASVPGTLVYNPVAGTVLSVGTHTVSVTFTPTDTTDYTSNTASVPVTVNSPSYTWGNVPIVGGGYVDGIVVHPTQPNVRYARTDVGGAYQWNQSLSKWVSLTDFIGDNNHAGCESIALDPTNYQNVYLAMGEYSESYGENGLFLISNNGGSSFTQVAAPFKMGSNDPGRTSGERMAVDPNLPTKLYYGSYRDGLWVSTNSGTSWSKVTSFPVYSTTSGGAGTGGTPPNNEDYTGYAGAGVVFVQFVNSSGGSGSATPVIYVGVSDTGTSGTGYSPLYVSTNAGATWAAVSGQPTGAYPIRSSLAASAAGANTLLYVAYSSGALYPNSSTITYGIGQSDVTGGYLYKYTLPPSTSPGTTGGTWTNITPSGTNIRPSGTQGGFESIVADPNNLGVVMATTYDDYYPGDDIYRSLNYGATWTSVVHYQGAIYNTSLSPWLLFGATSISGAGTWPSSLVIDPANSNHIMYGNGQTLWDSTNIQTSDGGNKVTFNVGASGIEEAVVQALTSPSSGPILFSGVDDLGGFVHTSLTASPANGMILNDALNPIDSIDYAASAPADVAVIGNSTLGAYSTNSGTSWTRFAASPSGTSVGEGQIAVSANGGTFVWSTADAPVAYTTNRGATWTASSGAIAENGIVSDRVNSSKFYIYSSSNGSFQISTNGGQSFTTLIGTGLPTSNTSGVLYASYAAEGDLWIAFNSHGLYHSTNSGTNWTSISGSPANEAALGFGAAAPGATYPTIYVLTSNSNVNGIYRSVNEAATWTQINTTTTNQYGYVHLITGDPKTFGNVYLGTGGRGVVLGTSPY